MRRRNLLRFFSAFPLVNLLGHTEPTKPWKWDFPPPIDPRTKRGQDALNKLGMDFRAQSEKIYYRRGAEWCYRKTKEYVTGSKVQTGPSSWRGPTYHFLARGPGYGIDPETLVENGKRYPRSQFKDEPAPDPRTDPRTEPRIELRMN
jgi:hypothetical protein